MYRRLVVKERHKSTKYRSCDFALWTVLLDVWRTYLGYIYLLWHDSHNIMVSFPLAERRLSPPLETISITMAPGIANTSSYALEEDDLVIAFCQPTPNNS